MATAADRLANNLNFGALGKAKELRQRLLFTLGALIVFRLGTFLPGRRICRPIHRAIQTVLEGLHSWELCSLGDLRDRLEWRAKSPASTGGWGTLLAAHSAKEKKRRRSSWS